MRKREEDEGRKREKLNEKHTIQQQYLGMECNGNGKGKRREGDLISLIL